MQITYNALHQSKAKVSLCQHTLSNYFRGYEWIELQGCTELVRLIIISDTFELCVQGDGYSYSSSGTIHRRKRAERELTLVPSWFKVVTNQNTITGADSALEYVSVLAPHVGTDVGRLIASYIDICFNIRRMADKGY